MTSIGPFTEISRIQSEINRLFDNLLELKASGGEGGGEWLPAADVYETSEELVVKFELPGVQMSEVTLAINGNNVIVRGEKKRNESMKGAKFHSMERSFGKFKRVVHISSPVNTHKAKSELREGVLKVSFPKVPDKRGEEHPIKIEERS
jgi:HSP20 family protein